MVVIIMIMTIIMVVMVMVVLVVVMAMMVVTMMIMLMVVVVIHSTDLCRFSAEMFGSMHSLPRFVMIGLKNAFGFCTW